MQCLLFIALALSLRAFAQDAVEPDTDSGYRYLLREATTSVNSKGLKTTRLHHRIEIQKQHAVDLVGDVSIPFNAFRSEARVVNAFTQTADGRTVKLDQNTVRDLTPDEVSSYQMYTDVHQITFSMPALAKGAIMDYEVEIEEKLPVMPGEFWVSEFLDASVQVCTSRVTVTFPARREVKVVAARLPQNAAFTDATNGSARTLTWEVKDVPALEYEPGMPPLATVRAQVHLTSVKSWETVTKWYGDLADKSQRMDEAIQTRARQLVVGVTNPLDQIQALYRYASRDVRYVGVELGRSAYEPHSPAETMRNKYGDCKDKAALLVALLKAIGIRSHLAIVRPNYDGPVNQELPGPSQFSHAIVYVPRETGDLWIDATQPFGEVTEHGYHLDDVDAMLIGLPNRTFVRIPALDATHSVHRLIYDVEVHYGGLCTVRETQEYVGRAAIAEREGRTRMDAGKVRKQLELNFGSARGYSRLLDFSFTSPTNDSLPMRVTIAYDSDTFLSSSKSGFTVRLDAANSRGWLDVPRPDTTSLRQRPRSQPWVSRLAHTEEILCRLHLPEGYQLSHAPTETRKEFPHGSAEMRFRDSREGPELTLRIVRQPATLEPEALPEIARQVDQAIARIQANLDFEDDINELMRELRFAEAEARVVDSARRATNSVDAMIRLGMYFKSIGRAYQSRLAFEKAIALSPQFPHGYALLSETYSGYWGFPGEGFDRKTMMDIYDRALTNVPVRAWTLNKKAEICLTDDQGGGDSTNRLAEAQEYFQEMLKADPNHYEALLGLGKVNRLWGRYDEAEDYYRKASRQEPGQVEPHAGIWTSLAYAGRDEEACNAIAAYYGHSQEQATETARVATLLMTSRRYASAANLFDRMIEASARPEVAQKLVRQLRKMESTRRDDYESYYSDSSPQELARTIVIATLMGDTNRVLRCLSADVNQDEARQALQRQSSLVSALSSRLDIAYFMDAALAALEISQRSLDQDRVEVRLDGSKASAANSGLGRVMTLQLQHVSNRWEAISLSDPQLDCGTFARLALKALERGDAAAALTWQAQIADVWSSLTPLSAANSPGVHLERMAFTNDFLRVKAWAGTALMYSRDRSDIGRGIACLKEVSAAYPEDAQIKMMLAQAHNQIANVRMSAEILESIDPRQLGAPNQLARLASMLLYLERLDAAERVMARLREVAPQEEQLLVTEAQALLLREKFAEAATALRRFRDRTKLDSRVSLASECFLISASNDKTALLDLIERWRDTGKRIPAERPMISGTCLGLGLNAEATEQVATMLSEGGLTAEALACYADVALARGDTAEARDLVARADRLSERTVDYDRLANLFRLHLMLGDFREAARGYREIGMRRVSDYAGYSLCMSALASRLAGDADAAADALNAATALQGDSDWPRLAIQYIRGDISEDLFRLAPERTTLTPLKRNSRACEVNCIIGMLKEAKHDIPGALAAYQACLATKSRVDAEYLIASLATQRLERAVNKAKP